MWDSEFHSVTRLYDTVALHDSRGSARLVSDLQDGMEGGISMRVGALKADLFEQSVQAKDCKALLHRSLSRDEFQLAPLSAGSRSALWVM